MTIIVHCDASSKEGWSTWCYKKENEKCVVGVFHSMNTAAIETLAVIKAIERINTFEPILIISDCLITVKVIQQTNDRQQHRYVSANAKPFYRKTKNRLIQLVKKYNISAVWIDSKNESPPHQEVDHMARQVLMDWLKRRV